jgi:threonyl-tRNA synthetase
MEQYQGKFPLWLNPIQVLILPISEKFHAYAQKLVRKLKQKEFRVIIDDRAEKLSLKIKQVYDKKIPYYVVIGEEEVTNNQITYSDIFHKIKNQKTSIKSFIKELKNQIINFM